MVKIPEELFSSCSRNVDFCRTTSVDPLCFVDVKTPISNGTTIKCPCPPFFCTFIITVWKYFIIISWVHFYVNFQYNKRKAYSFLIWLFHDLPLSIHCSHPEYFDKEILTFSKMRPSLKGRGDFPRKSVKCIHSREWCFLRLPGCTSECRITSHYWQGETPFNY